MHFHRLEIKNFGPIENLDFNLKPEGVHIITGGNGTGKTHVVAGILASLLGKATNFISFSRSQKMALMRLTLFDDTSEELLKLTVLPGGEIIHEFCCEDKQPVKMPHQRLLSIATDDFLPSLYFGELDVDRDFSIQDCSWLLEDNPFKGKAISSWREIQDRFALRNKSNVQLKHMSYGQRALIALALECSKRKDYPVSVPLILDDSLGMFPESMTPVIKEIIEDISERHQVIWLTSDHGSERFGFDTPVPIFKLSENKGQDINHVGIDYKNFSGLIFKKSNELYNAEIEQITQNRLSVNASLIEGQKEIINGIKELKGGQKEIKKDISTVMDSLELIISKVDHISEQVSEELEQALQQNNDILISQICSDLGRCQDSCRLCLIMQLWSISPLRGTFFDQG